MAKSYKSSERSLIALIVCWAFVTFSVKSLAASTTSMNGNVREFFSTNTEGRLTIALQVWGNVPLAGIHHVPDTTTLGQLISYAGGPAGGTLEQTTIKVLRRDDVGGDLKTTTYNGATLLSDTDVQGLRMAEGDLVYVEVDVPTDRLLLTSTLLGLFTSILLTIFLVKDKF